MVNSVGQSFPLGGRWTRSGRMRATYRKQSVVYQRTRAQRGTTDQIYLAQPDTIPGRSLPGLLISSPLDIPAPWPYNNRKFCRAVAPG